MCCAHEVANEVFLFDVCIGALSDNGPLRLQAFSGKRQRK
jgi:hypothetical protein